MNTDDLKVLARRADDVQGRSVDRLSEVHRRIRRTRRKAIAAVTLVVVAVLVSAGAVVVNGLEDVRPPVVHPEPTPTSTPTQTARPHPLYVPPKGTRHLTPRQTVQSYNATLDNVAASPDDPNVRLSVWTTNCERCRPTDYGRHLQPQFRAMALTRDGYRTTTYLRLPGVNVPVIYGPAPGYFLLADHANGEYRLLRQDGTLRTVSIVDQPREPTDPRRVFPCEPLTATGGGVVSASSAGPAWCVLDVRSATASPLPGTWIQNGDSDANPALGQEPWGDELLAPHTKLHAWWLDGGTRHSQELPGTWNVWSIRGFAREDGPLYWQWTLGSRVMELYAVPRRSGGLVSLGSRPFLPLTRSEMVSHGEAEVFPRMTRLPGGGLLAWSVRSDEIAETPRFTIWRAAHLTRGAFHVVYDGYFPADSSIAYRTQATREGHRLRLGALVSDDNGRTWEMPISTWR